MSNLFRNRKYKDVTEREIRGARVPSSSVSVTSSDSVVPSNVIKEILYCQTYSNSSTTLSGLYALNGRTLIENDLVLVNELPSVDNGVYIAKTSAWEKININGYFRFVISNGDFEGYEFKTEQPAVGEPIFEQTLPNLSIGVQKETKLITASELNNLSTIPQVICVAKQNQSIHKIVATSSSLFSPSVTRDINITLTDGTNSVNLGTITAGQQLTGFTYTDIQILNGYIASFSSDTYVEISTVSAMSTTQNLTFNTYYGTN